MMKKSFIITDEQTVVKRSRLPEKKKLDGKTKSTTSLKCPCKCKLAEENDLISCTNCKQLQHKTCYGILDSFGNQPNFYCVDCSTYGDYPLTDLIYIYVGKECQELCLTRRAISLCLSQHYFTKVNLEKLFGCNKTMTNAIIKKLIAQDFIELQINTGKYILNKSNIDFALQKYFPSTENKENEELMHEDSELETNSILPPTSHLISQQGMLSKSVDVIENSIRKLEPNSILPPTSSSYFQEGMLSKSVDVIENSIRKVKKLNLRDISPAKSSASRKRKVSSETVNLDDSEELFQSQKRLRVRKATKQYKS
ncbi:hypothetical protein HNY73_008543 [Argiope bruennichi]|uniref:Zinc finger PHD-type domain-containing protein n=1 Tax=Argiope bruennichi TaxID=94029 RepID=A0A8T0F9C4_ARGBR|nr:hypothetical protein HNY73_008543 [Argiope bruennichi]